MPQHTKYTDGEIKALIAPMLDLCAEEIDRYIILVQGRCSECHGHEAATMIENFSDVFDLASLMQEGLSMKLQERSEEHG